MVAFISCEESSKLPAKETIDYNRLPTFVNDTLQAVIEIPAGTNKKIEYNKEQNKFLIDSIDGAPRSIQFLPYIGNYGFVPSTYSNPKEGGDGDALDILVLAESQPIGSLLKVIPIGVLRLQDNGAIDDKIIAVPAQKDLQIIPVENFENLSLQFPEIRKMISLWFQNYDKKDELHIIAFNGEETAIEIIKKWAKN